MLRKTTTTHRFMYQKYNKYEIIHKKTKQKIQNRMKSNAAKKTKRYRTT